MFSQSNTKNQLASYRPFQERDVIKQLHSLRRAIGGTGNAGFQARVKFLILAYKHRLVRPLTSYQLWDEGWKDLGERQFDTCFEMGDSELVIAELIKTAREEGFTENIRELASPDTYARWETYADRQGALFS